MGTHPNSPQQLRQKQIATILFPAAAAAFFLVFLAISSAVASILAQVAPQHELRTQTIFSVNFVLVLLFMLWLWRNRRDALYFGIQSFFSVVIKIFFKKVDIIGLENIPKDGPVVFVANHQNQFVDGVLLTVACPRRMAGLMAAKSLARPVIGHFAAMMGTIPVVRAQDVAKDGKGTLTLVRGATKVVGEDTSFTSALRPGDSINVDGEQMRVAEVKSDTELLLALEPSRSFPAGCAYKVFPKLDHSQMFNAVFDELGEGGCIFIFPEGGSHDQTKLLPIKAGVALIALGAVDKYPEANVKIVPVGFNYFHGHRFRSKCLVDFGKPLEIEPEWVHHFQTNKKEATSNLLSLIEDRMRSVTINVPDYKTLKFVHTIRRLYQPTNMKLSGDQYIHLTQRFAAAYLKMREMDKFKGEADKLRNGCEKYMKLVSRHGMTPGHFTKERTMYGLRLIPYFLYVCIMAFLALIPGIVLNAPVGLLARTLSQREQSKALGKSTVKVAARDVVASYKLVVALGALPLWYAVVSLLLILFSGLKWSYLVLLIFSFPLFSYIGVRFMEQGIVTSRLIKPMYLRLFKSFRDEQEKILTLHRELQAQVRLSVEQYGPVIWGKDFQKHRIISRDEIRKRSTSVGEFVYDPTDDADADELFD